MNIGGKAKSLKILKEAGFNVPRFFNIDQSWDENKIINILEIEFSTVKYFAVRSSAAGEDGNKKSYAGHFYSAIAVKKRDVVDEVKKVIHSFAGFDGSVIIQEFIPSDVSGIAFSDNGEGVTIINSNFGLCKNVVDGKACDEFLINKGSDIFKRTVNKNKPGLFFKNEQLIANESSESSLTQEKIMRITKLANDVENYFNKPQDIEWCFLGENLYLLQSRPITKNINIIEQEYFDSANIAESYSGIVLPLTASFASMVYRVVYTDFLRMSGVSKKILMRHSYVFENLLGFYHGRMYYNMNNWYRLAQFVPGYKRNKENFETMITSNVKQEIHTKIKPSTLFCFLYPVIIMVKVLFFNITEKRFKNHIEKNIQRLKKINFSKLTIGECKNIFYFLENNLLRRWYVTLENDFFVMTYLGILQKIYAKDNLQETLLFKSKATEQVSHLRYLSNVIKKDLGLWNSILKKDNNMFLRILYSKPALLSQYEKYLEIFGGRFANELKLETVGIDEDTKKFMNVIRVYADSSTSSKSRGDEKMVELSFKKRILFKYFLKKFKKYASQREEFRLFRSNMFSITRSVFRRVGTILCEEKILKKSDDIFYLTVDEVLTLTNSQKINNLDLEIRKRKHEYLGYKNENPPTHFSKYASAIFDNSFENNINPITNRGVSAGVITGKIRVMKEFDMPEKIDFDILVTKNTDPGWTAIIALSKGLIIEHGGVLSHASIVARELGIPAVIGVKNATDIYKNGQVVSVNGSTGEINLI